MKPLLMIEPSVEKLNDELVTPLGPAVPLYCTPLTVTLSQHDSVLKR